MLPVFKISRRTLVAGLGALTMSIGLSCKHSGVRYRQKSQGKGRLLFVSRGRTAMVDASDGKVTEFNFNAPGQATWQPAGFFSDGRRMLLLSMEPRRDGPGKPFEEYYTQTPTHLWDYDLGTGRLREVANRERMAVFYTPALMLGDDRLLVQVVKNRVGQIYSMNLDGSDAREFTKAGEGLPYGLSLSPDRKRVAFHLASPAGYQIWTSDLEGSNRSFVAGCKDHLYFGPSWSPDGRWLAFADCLHGDDPGHDWADVCIAKPDGTEFQVVTEGQRMWFAATYGLPARKGGGSNVVSWTKDGRILFAQRSIGAKVPWEYQANRPDLDHFNRDYKPDAAKGGTQLVLLDPNSRSIQPVTSLVEGRWDFRGAVSETSDWVAFCRTNNGGVPALWISRLNGSNARELVREEAGAGVDHPRWFPNQK